MKWWVLQIFSINGDLDRLCEKIDRGIQKLALSSSSAPQLYERIAELNEKKADLVNLRVLYNMMSEGLTVGELATLVLAAQNAEYKRSELKVGCRCRTDLDKLVRRCVSVAIAAGYYSKKLERIYPYLCRKPAA